MNYQREAILLLLTAGIILRVWHWSINKKIDRLDNPKQSQEEQIAKPEKMDEVSPLPTKGIPALKADKRSISASADFNIPFPVEGKSRQHIISFFGDPRDGGKRKHQGVDIGAPRGTNTLAVAKGVIKRVKTGGAGGKQVWLLADDGWLYYYGHLHEQLVKEGQKVRKGDIIGTVGNTGNARYAGPHLHFEMHTPEEETINPLPYLGATNP